MGKKNSNSHARLRGLNKHQRAALRPGEKRVGREEIHELLQLSQSKDSADRLLAASFLCPCHVRKRIDEVWAALYRMLEDEDIKVRRAAWHTLEDGGKPDDPALDTIIERTLEQDADSQVLGYARKYAHGRKIRKDVEFEVAAISEYADRGKCDFCGDANVPIKTDFETELDMSGSRRFAMVCEPCDNNA